MNALKLLGADGMTMNVLSWSDTGIGLLFLHGFGNDAHVWDEIAPTFAPYYRTLAMDLRGHGDSSHDPERRYFPERMSLDVDAVLDQLKIERVVVVGHSLGGRVSLHFAKRNHARLAGLVLVDIAPDVDPRGVTRIQLDVSQAPQDFASIQEYEAVLARQYPEAKTATLAKLAHHWSRETPEGRFKLKLDKGFITVRAETSAERAEELAKKEADELWTALRAMPCPTLVIRGAASDILSADTADKMVDEALPKGRLEVVARAGHSVMIDNPEGFIKVLSGFVLGDA